MHWTAKLELIAFLQATSGGVNDSRVFVHKSERFAIYKSRGLILPHCEDLIKRHKAKIYYLPLGMFGASTENLVGRLFEIDLQWKQFEDFLVAIILRKRTMLITTAKWMTNLPCPSMTPEKRPGKFLCWKNSVPDMFSVSVRSEPLPHAREVLHALQSMKSIRMVKKYRDKSGRLRVASNLVGLITHTKHRNH